MDPCELQAEKSVDPCDNIINTPQPAVSKYTAEETTLGMYDLSLAINLTPQIMEQKFVS